MKSNPNIRRGLKALVYLDSQIPDWVAKSTQNPTLSTSNPTPNPTSNPTLVGDPGAPITPDAQAPQPANQPARQPAN